MPRVTIVGSGFAALTAIQSLRDAASKTDITVVSPSAEFVYYPGLIWVPTGLRTGDDLRIPLKGFFRRMGVNHVAAEATGLHDGGRVLETSSGDIENDGLIIGSGGRFIKKLPGIEHAITPCEGIAAAERRHAGSMPEVGAGRKWPPALRLRARCSTAAGGRTRRRAG